MTELDWRPLCENVKKLEQDCMDQEVLFDDVIDYLESDFRLDTKWETWKSAGTVAPVTTPYQYLAAMGDQKIKIKLASNETELRGISQCDFFLWNFAKDSVYVPPLPTMLPKLRRRINTAINNVTLNLLERVWRELDNRPDICHVTRGSNMECLGKEQAKVWGFPDQCSGPEMSTSGVHAQCGENVLVRHRA
ncbi:hypothetical protein ANN_24613 [Periplaneta americana]|uniref:Uncharacterized protein n=1 Tax=Periplaneta americana TaxID=6978 RepID=A0ABQ8S3V4_PERAM|nr:hypothetical protein ANN_24613 [Periplaneta americana]